MANICSGDGDCLDGGFSIDELIEEIVKNPSLYETNEEDAVSPFTDEEMYNIFREILSDERFAELKGDWATEETNTFKLTSEEIEDLLCKIVQGKNLD